MSVFEPTKQLAKLLNMIDFYLWVQSITFKHSANYFVWFEHGHWLLLLLYN